MKNVMKMAAISTIVAAAGAANAAGSYTNVLSTPSNEFHISRLVEAIATSSNPTNIGPAGAITPTLVGGREFYDFGNNITAKRVFDFMAGPNNTRQLGGVLNLFNGSDNNTTDQIWQDGTVALDVRARYSSGEQTLGFLRNSDNSGNANLLNISNAGGWFQFIDPTNATNVFVGPGEFRWTRNTSQTSREIDNGNTDRMIAFEIFDTNAPSERRYVIAFEDGGDFDYNDLVVELVIMIPLPTGAAMGMAGMGLLAIRRRGVR
jgi:hypothetical protein